MGDAHLRRQAIPVLQTDPRSLRRRRRRDAQCMATDAKLNRK
jgi:hypothetical protein